MAGRGERSGPDPLQAQGFGGEGAGGFDVAGVIDAQSLDPGCSQGQFLGADAFDTAATHVGIEFGHGEMLVAGLFNRAI